MRQQDGHHLFYSRPSWWAGSVGGHRQRAQLVGASSTGSGWRGDHVPKEGEAPLRLRSTRHGRSGRQWTTPSSPRARRKPTTGSGEEQPERHGEPERRPPPRRRPLGVISGGREWREAEAREQPPFRTSRSPAR